MFSGVSPIQMMSATGTSGMTAMTGMTGMTGMPGSSGNSGMGSVFGMPADFGASSTVSMLNMGSQMTNMVMQMLQVISAKQMQSAMQIMQTMTAQIQAQGANAQAGMSQMLGNYMNGTGTQGAAAGNQAPQANGATQIPSFGANPSKAQIGQQLSAAAQKYGIPENILKAVAWQESTWNARALSFDGQHGKGVMQIDDRYHNFAKTQDVFDSAKNIDYGAKYLADLYKQTGSWTAALKRYNGGSSYPPKIMALSEKQPWKQYGG